VTVKLKQKTSSKETVKKEWKEYIYKQKKASINYNLMFLSKKLHNFNVLKSNWIYVWLYP